jgi:hypothetical protein
MEKGTHFRMTTCRRPAEPDQSGEVHASDPVVLTVTVGGGDGGGGGGGGASAQH